MASGQDKKTISNNAIDDKLTLSAALLAPINSLFEVQIQAGRALLNFILQIGFKDKYSKRDLEIEEARLMEYKEKGLNVQGQKLGADEEQIDFDEKLEDINYRKEILNTKERYYLLKNKPKLSSDEKEEYAKLIKKQADSGFLDEMYSMDFKYFDGENVEHKISVPALALVPVQPLAIKSASFDFFMSVDTSKYENYEQMQQSRSGDSVRPWMFIGPKRIKGTIGSEDSKKTSAGISIKVEVESTPIPQGLSNLLISLTQSTKIKNDL